MEIPPRSGKHTHTFVILHGRGSNGENFGLDLLQTTIPSFGFIQDAFSNAKFIFPTAAKRRAQAYKRSIVHQWFDIWDVENLTEREQLQFDGLRESTTFIHGVLEAEIAIVGADKVMLWGLSQGCATTMMSTLLWQGEKYAAAIGMCGYLPLRKRVENSLLEDDLDDQDDNPFARTDEEVAEDGRSKLSKVAEYLREELEMPP